jgi:hypothetical protein
VREGREVLIIDAENRVQRREIESIWSDERQVVARENLKPGELLCTTPLLFAADGVQVVPRIEGEPAPQTKEGQLATRPGGQPGPEHKPPPGAKPPREGKGRS